MPRKMTQARRRTGRKTGVVQAEGGGLKMYLSFSAQKWRILLEEI